METNKQRLIEARKEARDARAGSILLIIAMVAAATASAVIFGAAFHVWGRL